LVDSFCNIIVILVSYMYYLYQIFSLDYIIIITPVR